MPIKMKVNSQQICMTVERAKVIYPKDTATYILQDEDGNEVVGVVSDEKVIFTATENDIRDGKIAATGEGITEGKKVIPAYHTTEAIQVILPGEDYAIHLPINNLYAYTKLQAIICPYNTSLSDSISAEKVVIDNNTYNVQSTTPLSAVTIDDDEQTINFGIRNTSEISYVLRFFTYKEIL